MVNFTVWFQQPYMYGLLNKKDDLLIFECINSSLLLKNPGAEILAQDYGSIRIEMQFDFRGMILDSLILFR